jgi:hypothetical protein
MRVYGTPQPPEQLKKGRELILQEVEYHLKTVDQLLIFS